MRLKPLILKFSYNSILNTCKNEDWRLPTLEEVKGKKCEYDAFWIDHKEEEGHAYIYDASDGKAKLANKSFKFNIMVAVIDPICKNCIYHRESFHDEEKCSIINICGLGEMDDFGCTYFKKKDGL